MALSLKIAAHSEIGLVRTNNQDSAYTSPTMLVVADGMGGAAAGDLASAVAIRELRRADEQNELDPQHPDEGTRLEGGEMLESLSGALSRANDTLADLVVWDHALEGMGTTVCGAMFSGTQYGICHIGDSRGYLLRDGRFRQLTHDHSWVQSLVDEGKIRPEEAAEHPHRSLLLKVLNGQPTHTPDFMLVDAQAGDRLLFCSDGLSGMVDDSVIESLMAGEDLDKVVADLTAAAHEGGGLDNITIVVADVVEQDAALDAAPPVVLGAAATVEIPKPGSAGAIDLGDRHEDTHRLLGNHVPAAPAPVADEALPEGVIDPDQFEAFRYQPHLPSRRRRWLPVLISVLALIVLVALAIWGTRTYLSMQYYIGPHDDRVAIYQGIPDSVVGQPLHELVETSSVRISDLPRYYAGKVRDQDLRYAAIDDARNELFRLDEMAQRCIAERAATASPSPTPSATQGTPGESATPATPDPTAAPTPAGTAGPSPSSSASSPVSSSASTRTPSGSGTNRPDLEACG